MMVLPITKKKIMMTTTKRTRTVASMILATLVLLLSLSRTTNAAPVFVVDAFSPPFVARSHHHHHHGYHPTSTKIVDSSTSLPWGSQKQKPSFPLYSTSSNDDYSNEAGSYVSTNIEIVDTTSTEIDDDETSTAAATTTTTYTVYEYDYEPSNPNASPIRGGDKVGDDRQFVRLRSSYPPDTPAGLRGEAVRSALVTTQRCLGWIREERRTASSSSSSLSSSSQQTEDGEITCPAGILQVTGRGTMDFLNNKLSQSFSSPSSATSGAGSGGDGVKNRFYDACLLDPKGRVVDFIQVALINQELAYLITSPGYSSLELLKRLEPFIFPLDEVTLTHFPAVSASDSVSAVAAGDEVNSNDLAKSCFSFCLASTQYNHVQTVMKDQSKLSFKITSQNGMVFPGKKQSVVWTAVVAAGDSTSPVKILVIPTVGLPAAACVGYTFVFLNENNDGASGGVNHLGKDVWQRLIDEENLEGPIELGPLEYESLRIEAGQPACGYEFGPVLLSSDDGKKKNGSKDNGTTPSKSPSSSNFINTNPLELHCKSRYIDFEKGCYLGQEGIASVVKNPRGPPRLLYSVVFEDDFNIYDTQSEDDDDENEFADDDFENLTKAPQPGQKLYALGSNEELLVGSLTSVAEPGATGGAETVGLALIKRADSIIKQMKEMDLQISRDDDDDVMFNMNAQPRSSGFMQPPPMDPLDGLEVVVEGTYTVGRLKCIPSRRIRIDSNLFDDTINVEEIPDWEHGIDTSPEATTELVSPTSDLDLDSTEDTQQLSADELEEEIAKAAAEAEAAAAEAKRKEEKMEMLKKRAEEAMARRQNQKKE